MKKLKEVRELYNFNYQQMADFLDISKTFYWQLEHNKRRLSYDMAIKIANIFRLKPDDLFYSEFKNKD